MAKPVILKRSGEQKLPDISDIFGGYEREELPAFIPKITPHTNLENTKKIMDEDGLLLLELKLGKSILNEALPAYRQGDIVLLPIGQLADAVQFPIRLDMDTKRAEGWFSEEDKTLLLDAARNRVTISGQIESVNDAEMAIHDDDIYVSSALLSQWFSIDFTISYHEQTIAIAGKNNMALPAEKMASRELARTALRTTPTDTSANYPIVREPYHFATMPFANVVLSSNYDGRTKPNAQSDASILSNGDLLYMHQNSYLSYDRERGLENARLTLSRKDPEGKLLQADEVLASTWLGEAANSAKLTDFTIGDMFSAQLPLTMLNQNGRGVMLTNQPLDRNNRFDRTTIEGNIEPDWEVELYRNDDLLAFQRSTSTGRYEFSDVPLFTGLNIIRLVFYGPFGQSREEIRRVLVNPNITEEGKSFIRFTAMQQSKNLLGDTTGQGAFASNFLVGLNNIPLTNTEGESRYAFEYEYGLRDNLALYTNITHTPITGELATDAATVGLGGVWKDIYGRVDLAQAGDGGQAMQLNTQTDLFGLNLSLEHQEFKDFLSDFTENISDPVTRRSTGRVDGALDMPILPRLSLGVAAARTAYESGRTRDEINQRTTSQIFGASVNHNTTFSIDRFTNNLPGLKQTRGSLLVSAPLLGAYVRGGTTYRITPDTQIENAAIAVDYSFSNDLVSRAEVFRQISGGTVNTLNTSLTKNFKHYSLSISAGADDNGEKQAGISLGFSFGMEPRSNQWMATADPISQSGLISARSYIDVNNNNLLDADETVLQDTGYLINESKSNTGHQHTLADVQLLTFIPEYELTSVVVNPSTLEDPFLVAGDSGVRVVSRPGTPVALDFPLKRAADIEGLITLTSPNGEEREAANVLVEAVNNEGKVIRSARSAFDGVYLLELLPAGTYTIQISEEQSARLGFKHTSKIPLIIAGDEETISDINLNIRR